MGQLIWPDTDTHINTTTHTQFCTNTVPCKASCGGRSGGRSGGRYRALAKCHGGRERAVAPTEHPLLPSIAFENVRNV